MIKSKLTRQSRADSNPMDRLTRSFLEARDDLLRFLKRRGWRASAEDILQSVWVKLRERDDCETWREPRAMLFVTAAHLGIDTHRREAVAMRMISREAALTGVTNQSPDPEAQADAVRRVEKLWAALEELPAQCRDAFLLNRLENLTHAQIAARLGISTKTVQRHIERAVRVCVQVSE